MGLAMKITLVKDINEARAIAGARPFRAPAHSSDMCTLLSEVAMATGGVLFLQDLHLYTAPVLRVAMGAVRSMHNSQHPHTPEVLATTNITLATLHEAGFTLSHGQVE